MKKLKAVLLAVCMLMAVGAQPAFASTGSFDFTFYDLHSPQSTDAEFKNDNAQNWYVSLDKNGYNNLGSYNVFGCKVHKTDGDNITRYHTFSNYGSGYNFPYTTTVHQYDNIFLTGQKDDIRTSPSYSYLQISGRFTP